MSLGLTKTKRRIASIKSTQKITKAMEMVAMVKLRRGKAIFDNDGTYVSELEKMIGRVFAYDTKGRTHYSKNNEGVEGDLYIVITSDMGLCAGYNSNIFKYVDAHIRNGIDYIAPIGNKGATHFKESVGYKNIIHDYEGLNVNNNRKQALEYALKVKADFNNKKYRSVILVYTHYVNSLRFDPAQVTLLPVSIEYQKEPSEEYCPPLFEPTPREMIHQMLPRYLSAEIYGRVLESSVSEQASRRTAMENANDNADELLETLTTEYNKARQGAITQEIVEVVSGANNQ